MIAVVSNYINFLSKIKSYIDDSPYKTNYIYESLEMSKQVFYRKIKTKSFAPEEVLTISKILFPREAILLELQKSSEDKKAGRVVEHSEAMSILRKKHL